MKIYKIAKLYNVPIGDGENVPMPVFIDLEDGTKKQIKDIMLIPENYDDFKGKKDNVHGGWVGWSVAFKKGKGWESKKWFVNDWEAEAWVREKYPKG